MLRDATELAQRLDRLNDALRAAGDAPLTSEQRNIAMAAWNNAEPFSVQQRLNLRRVLRTSERWPHMRACAARETAP